MHEQLAAGYPRPTSVHFRCEQRFFSEASYYRESRKPSGHPRLWKQKFLSGFFFCMNTDAYHPNGPI